MTKNVLTPFLPSAQTMATTYQYNNRNELTSATTGLAATSNLTLTPLTLTSEIPGRSFGYAFDPIGNRTTETIEGTPHAYNTNNLNQYTDRQTPWWLPVSGMANHATTQVTIGDNPPAQPDNWLNNYYYKQEPKAPPQNTPSGTGYLQPIPVTADDTATGKHFAETRRTLARPAAETFQYDLDGNLTQDSLWIYTYDGENRLSTMTSRVPDATNNRTCVKFTYDYMGRRVRKDVYDNPTDQAPCERTIFLYQGWTLLAEYSSVSPSSSSSPLILARKFTWGPDLSGTMGGAGDIGGLLAIEDLRAGWKGIFHPSFDGNGNLMALHEASTGNMVAAYEYDPFGNPVRTSGVYAKENPIRFSGKYFDVETGLTYFGFRYYNASLGRFINRDLLEERGAWNLYNGLKQEAADPYAGASGVEGTSWSTEWEQAQDRLLSNTSLPHTTQSVTFDGKRNSGLPGASEANQKTYSANATGHYPQGGAEGTGPKAPSMSVGDPATGNADINLYIYAGNNPINSLDALGLQNYGYYGTGDWHVGDDIYAGPPHVMTPAERRGMVYFVGGLAAFASAGTLTPAVVSGFGLTGAGATAAAVTIDTAVAATVGAGEQGVINKMEGRPLTENMGQAAAYNAAGALILSTAIRGGLAAFNMARGGVTSGVTSAGATSGETATENTGSVLVRHYTSNEGLAGIKQSQSIVPSRGNPIGVHVEVGPNFGPAATGSADTGAAGRGAFVQFTTPKSSLQPTYVGPRQTAVIPTQTPLSIARQNPTYVSKPWWKFW